MPNPSGFAEHSAPPLSGSTEMPPSAHAVLGQDGRVLIPAALREAAGIERGERLYLQVIDGQIVVESFRKTLKRLQDLMAPEKKPGVSYVDEFLAGRRAMWGEDE